MVLKNSRSQSGQLVVEAVLLMTVLLGMTVMVTKFLREAQIAQKLTKEPWEKLSGMIECGVWQPCAGTQGLHPSTRDRGLTKKTTRGG